MRRTLILAATLAATLAAGPAAAFEVQSGGVLLRENPAMMAALAGGGKTIPPWMAKREKDEAAPARPGAPGQPGQAGAGQPGGLQGMSQQQLGALLFGGSREGPAKPGAAGKAAASGKSFDDPRAARGLFR
ncbi:hypothetical protein [Azospirillum sp.]|uniref:hypothetical protein n=1 Tax=Azospirillum sp. TaxID=34012 RepID=UPI002D324BE8|nr:hypothetical protein [Azospirillum sp.]HYD66063.1 hypothetical protein [Azospirillum sp.]